MAWYSPLAVLSWWRWSLWSIPRAIKKTVAITLFRSLLGTRCVEVNSCSVLGYETVKNLSCLRFKYVEHSFKVHIRLRLWSIVSKRSTHLSLTEVIMQNRDQWASHLIWLLWFRAYSSLYQAYPWFRINKFFMST